MPCSRCGGRSMVEAERVPQHVEYACLDCGARRYEDLPNAMPPCEYIERARYNGSGALAEKVVTIRWRYGTNAVGHNRVLPHIACPFCGDEMRRVEVSYLTLRKRREQMRFVCRERHAINVNAYKGAYPKGASRWRWE